MAKKWFDAQHKRDVSLRPDPTLLSGLSDLEAADIEQLVLEMYQHRVEPTTAEFFAMLGQMSPVARLSRNVKVVVRILTDRDIQGILHDGCEPQERDALCKLELAGLAPKERLTAQKLLNIDERFQLHRILAEAFRRARLRRGGVLLTNGRLQ